MDRERPQEEGKGRGARAKSDEWRVREKRVEEAGRRVLERWQKRGKRKGKEKEIKGGGQRERTVERGRQAGVWGHGEWEMDRNGGTILSCCWVRNSLLANERQFGVGRKPAGHLVCSLSPSHLGPSFLCPLPFLGP